ncbi:WD repeat-containing protein 43 [Anopheles cruzii]|uniref:WD repeat-containing protein 43 n=1 Tax=Anopheles cruzii TaxID=68878 RepID=UPI0022EC5D3C|nr:WD repeat-containing protein 43 [Anopheles cruzii]
MSLVARAFSPDGKYCGYINQHGKFVVYDVETSALHQVYTPNMHLNVPCTSFTWIEVGVQATTPKGKGKKRQTKQLLAAFGTSKGGVIFYNLATATVERTCLGEGHSAPVTAIYFNEETDPDTIFTAGADGKVIEWSISKWAQTKVHNIGVEKLTCVLAHSATILTGAKQLKLWDCITGRLTATLIGHTSNTQILQLLAVEPDQMYAISGSANDRNLSLWSLDGNINSPVASFALDDVPEYVSVKLVDRKLHLVAVSRTGVSHYFLRSVDKFSLKRPYRANHTFEIAIDSSNLKTKAVDRMPVFVASVHYSPNEEQILLGYGTETNLRFEQIAIEANVKTNVIIRAPTKLLAGGNAKQAGDLKTKIPTVDNGTAEYLNPVNAGKKSMKKVEIPMEVRLENLSLFPDRSSGNKTVTGRKNMVHLLVQGLHSKDATILKSVFGRNDPETIQQTVERIPAQYLGALLTELSHLMQLKTVHVQTAVCWLKQLITIHASQLMALGSSNLLANFATCIGIIEYRVEHLNSLAKLRGRLGLLIEQTDRSKKQAVNQGANDHVLVYQEEDDSDVDSVLEMDNEQLGSSSEAMYDEVDQGEEYDEEAMSATAGGSAVVPQNGFSLTDEENSSESDKMDFCE